MTREVVKIGEREVGKGQSCFVVAEVAQAHDGSLGMAHAFIDAAADAGVDAVKFQTHIAAAESTEREKFRVKFSKQDATRYDYWKRMEFTEGQWCGLKQHAAEAGLVFLSSPFSVQAVQMLDRLGMPAWKVGSGETANRVLLKSMADTGKPIMLSTGMSGWDEIDKVAGWLGEWGCCWMLYQCVSKYPSAPEDIGLDLIGQMHSRYGVPVGLSDHSGTIYAGIAAAAVGAASVEIHIAMSRQCFGPDVQASVTPEELKKMVGGVRFVEKAMHKTSDKDAVASGMEPMREMFGRSIVAVGELPAGHVLTGDDLAVKKPGGGLPPEMLEVLIGKKLLRTMAHDEVLSEDDVE